MSSSATIYRISKSLFEKIKSDLELAASPKKLAVSSVTFDQSYSGLEFVLAKMCGDENKEIISEIFLPQQSIGGNSLSNEEFEKLMMQGKFEQLGEDTVAYLSPEKIKRLTDLLERINESDILINYSSEELNNNGIYPCVWHNDEYAGQAFNSTHLIEDFIKLKTIIKNSVASLDYLLVFTG